MKNQLPPKMLLLGGLFALLLGIFGKAGAGAPSQTSLPCPASEAPSACLVLSLQPPGITADVSLDGVLLASQIAQTALSIAPDTAHTLSLTNITDPTANGVYRYLDLSQPINLRAGQQKTLVLSPKKEFLLGFYQLTCRLQGILPTHGVACEVWVDGVSSGVVPHAQKLTLNLPPGAHSIDVRANGNDAGLWDALSKPLTVNIIAGRTTFATATLNRKGILQASLSDPQAIADFWLDGVQTHSAVATAEWVVPANSSHIVQIQNVRHASLPDWLWQSAQQQTFVSANQTRQLIFRLGKPIPTPTLSPTPLPTFTPIPTLDPRLPPPHLTTPRGDGKYIANQTIAFGKWRSTGTGERCYWSRKSENGIIQDNHYGLAGGTITIQPGDFEIEFKGCGSWQFVEFEVPVLQANANDPKGNGIYTVGVEIATGMWHSDGVGANCYWERRTAYQGILDNHFGVAGGVVTIRPGDYEVEFNDCGTWRLLPAERTPMPNAGDPKTDGFYVVGWEINSGVWQTTGAGSDCYWAVYGPEQQIYVNHYGSANQTLFIVPEYFELHISRCGQIVFLHP